MKIDEAFISILFKYADFEKAFFTNLVVKLPMKYIEINNHAIILIESYNPFYRPIYSLKLVELETLETYINTNLANSFIKLS